MVLAAAPQIVQGVIEQARAGNKTALELYFRYGLAPAREAKHAPAPRITNSMNVAIALVSPDGAPVKAEVLDAKAQETKANRQAGMARARAKMLAHREARKAAKARLAAKALNAAIPLSSPAKPTT
jgi:hypothetical protein